MDGGRDGEGGEGKGGRRGGEESEYPTLPALAQQLGWTAAAPVTGGRAGRNPLSSQFSLTCDTALGLGARRSDWTPVCITAWSPQQV